MDSKSSVSVNLQGPLVLSSALSGPSQSAEQQYPETPSENTHNGSGGVVASTAIDHQLQALSLDSSSSPLSYKPQQAQAVNAYTLALNSAMYPVPPASVQSSASSVPSNDSLLQPDTDSSLSALYPGGAEQALSPIYQQAYPQLQLQQTQGRNYNPSAFTISVQNIPPSYQWKELRDLVQSRVPNLNVIYTKITSPGSGLLTIKGYAGAIACAQQLNGLVIQPGVVISALMLAPTPAFVPNYNSGPAGTNYSPSSNYSALPNYSANSYTPADDETQTTASPLVAGTPVLYSPMLSHPGLAGAPSAAQAAQYYNGYPMMYDPSAFVSWGSPSPALYGPGSPSVNQNRTPFYHNNGGLRRGPSLNSGRNPPYPVIPDKQRLFIGNIPFSTQWQDLKDYLRTGGNIFRVEIPEYENGQSKGYAIATFYTEQDAANAILMFDRSVFNGRELNVRYDKHRRFNQGSSSTPTAPTDPDVNDLRESDPAVSETQKEPELEAELELESAVNQTSLSNDFAQAQEAAGPATYDVEDANA